jgi:hypothetical protein
MAEDAGKGKTPEDDVEKLVEIKQWEGEKIHLQKMAGDGNDSRCHYEGKVSREEIADPALDHTRYFAPHGIALIRPFVASR